MTSIFSRARVSRVTGLHRGGAELFWSFYFIATGLHGLHMIVGVGLGGLDSLDRPRRPLLAALFHAGGGGGALLELRRYGLALPLSSHLSRRPGCVMTAMRSLVVWLFLLLLVGAEFLLSRFAVTARLVPAVGLLMAGIVAMSFMRLSRATGLPAIFAVAAAFWLLIMMGMGGLDPVTRHDIRGLMQMDPRSLAPQAASN